MSVYDESTRMEVCYCTVMCRYHDTDMHMDAQHRARATAVQVMTYGVATDTGKS